MIEETVISQVLQDEDSIRWFEQLSRKEKRRRLREAGIHKGFREKGGR